MESRSVEKAMLMNSQMNETVRKQVGFKLRDDLYNWLRQCSAKSNKPIWLELENILLWAKKLSDTVVDVDKEVDRLCKPTASALDEAARKCSVMATDAPVGLMQVMDAAKDLQGKTEILPLPSKIIVHGVSDLEQAKRMLTDASLMASYPPSSQIDEVSGFEVPAKQVVVSEPANDPRAAWFAKTGFNPASLGPVKKKPKAVDLNKYPNFGEE